MPYSTTAASLAKGIKASGLTHREIADRCGFKQAEIISEMASGELRVPLEQIQALAHILGLDERKFLIIAIQEYYPGVQEVLVETLGLPMSDAELGIALMFRMASLRGNIETEAPFRTALEALLELTAGR